MNNHEKLVNAIKEDHTDDKINRIIKNDEFCKVFCRFNKRQKYELGEFISQQELLKSKLINALHDKLLMTHNIYDDKLNSVLKKIEYTTISAKADTPD